VPSRVFMPGRGETEIMANTKAIRVKRRARLESGLHDEVLREEVRASMADERRSVPIDEVFKHGGRKWLLRNVSGNHQGCECQAEQYREKGLD